MPMGFSLREPKIRLLTYANAAIAIALTLGILIVVRDLVSSPLKQQTRAWEPRKRVEGVIPKRIFQDYGIILEKNPFGFPAGKLNLISVASSSKVESTPRFDANLIGTVSGPDHRGFAIFSDRRGTQEVFAVGDSVFGMGRLKGVKKDRVFVIEGGREIEIALIDTTLVKELTSPYPGEIERSNVVQLIGDESYLLNQETLLKAIENPSQIMTEARLLPYVVEGNVQGFVLGEVKPGGIYESLGLQDGDVLVRINEYDISTPESALQAFAALKGMDLVQLDVLRNGSPMTLTYQIQ